MESLSRGAAPLTAERLSRAQRRELVRELLKKGDLPRLVGRIQADRRLLPSLVATLTEPHAVVRWRAIEVLGQVVAAEAEEDRGRAREIVRRLLWSLNEESGGNLRHGPEALGEILAVVPCLGGEYAGILASFAGEPFFRPAVMWGLARIAAVNPALLSDCRELLAESVRDGDPDVRLWAAVALRALGASTTDTVLAPATADATPVEVYSRTQGAMKPTTIADLVAQDPRQVFCLLPKDRTA